jgi:NAD(P)-dependent dehydrogenase (short-subunit alcohol dehydrogenase family)
MADQSHRASVLITGAAGGLGRLLGKHLAHSYSLSLLDCRPLGFTSSLPFHQIDLAVQPDLSSCFPGVTTILHFAGIPTAQSSWEDLLAANVVATQNVLRGALRYGCRRVILASSVQVMDGYPPGTDITPGLPVWPVNPYAVSKACAEAVAARFGRKEGISVICLRLGWVLPHFDWRITPWSPYLNRVLTEVDFLRVVNAAIERSPDTAFEIHHALSDNRRKRLNIDSARVILGYSPRDDAYKIAPTNIPGMARSAGISLRKRMTALRHISPKQEGSANAAD